MTLPFSACAFLIPASTSSTILSPVHRRQPALNTTNINKQLADRKYRSSRLHSRHQRISNCSTTSSSSSTTTLHDHVSSSWNITLDPERIHSPQLSLVHETPPLLRHSNLLTDAECEALIESQQTNTTESSLYLNYRVNKDIKETDTSQSSEARDLIAATQLSATSNLTATSLSGFRSQVDSTNPIITDKLLPRLHSLLGFHERREWVFEEGAWVRPNKLQIVIRDITTVHYNVGEGVAPHVDGKDLTVLICLKEPKQGGGTTFTREGITVQPVKGAGIMYKSKTEMPHFAEVVEDGEKWVLQLLIDYKIRKDEMNHVNYRTGKVMA